MFIIKNVYLGKYCLINVDDSEETCFEISSDSNKVDVVEKKIIPEYTEQLPNDIKRFLMQEIVWIATKTKKHKTLTSFMNRELKS